MIDPNELDDIQIDGIDSNDYPEFSDAFIVYAEIDGRELTDKEYN